MENNNLLSIPSDSQTKPKRSGVKLGLIGWILIFGLIALNVGIFIETDIWNKRTINKIFYFIDPRCWSLLPVPILWGLVCWFVTDFLCRWNVFRRKRFWFRLAVVTVTLCSLLLLCGWSARKIQMQIYYGVYMAYFVGPTANYMATGILSWKMFIAPAMFIVTITFLLYFMIKLRRPKS
jgi:hypothetical protein